MRVALGILFSVTGLVLFLEGLALMVGSTPTVEQLALAFILSGVSAVAAGVVKVAE